MTSGSGIIHGFKYLSPVGGREKKRVKILSFPSISLFKSYFEYGTYQTLVPYTGNASQKNAMHLFR